VALLFGVTSIYAYSVSPSLIGFIEETIGGLRGWAVIFATVCISVFPPFVFTFMRDLVSPGLSRLVREREISEEVEAASFATLMENNKALRETSEDELDDIKDEAFPESVQTGEIEQ
jgi:hypothetical protein